MSEGVPHPQEEHYFQNKKLSSKLPEGFSKAKYHSQFPYKCSNLITAKMVLVNPIQSVNQFKIIHYGSITDYRQQWHS